MLWKRVFRQEKGNTIFVPCSPTALKHFLYSGKKAIKLISLCSETQWPTDLLADLCLGLEYRKTQPHTAVALGWEVPPWPMKSLQWLSLLCLGGNGENVPAASLGAHTTGPTPPWLLLSLQLKSTLTAVNRGKNIPRMSRRTNKNDHSVFSWLIPLIPSHFLSHSLISI